MRWPFHPQWFTKKEPELIYWLNQIPNSSLLLDIGCADKWVQKHLPHNVRYIGLDYPITSQNMYRTKPDIFSTAEQLPFSDNSIDRICILDVLEHLKHPTEALKEAARTLKSDGEIILRVPFLYPIHDAPVDFTRFTQYGLIDLASKCNLKVARLIPVGHALETAALLKNLAYSKALLDLLENKNPLSLLGLLLPIYFLVNNTFSFLVSRLLPQNNIMPHTYLLSLKKTS